MPSRLSHCILLSFIGLALVQISYANTLHTDFATKQWANQLKTESYVEAAIEELEKIKFPLAPQTIASVTTCFNGDDDSYTSYGNAIGQFGTSDFSIGFWIETTESATQLFDVIGNRDSGAHGNYVQVRMYPQAYACFAEAGAIAVEIDQDSTGTNYIFVASQGGLNDGKWHHVAVVRQGTSLSLYIDGTLSKQGSASGVANINGAYDFRVGRSLDSSILSTRFTGEACYTGIQIENRAWTASEIATTYSTTRPE